MDKKTKVFIDTNIWFSALYKKGPASILLEKLLSKKYTVVISELVLEEIIRTLEEKLPDRAELVKQFLLSYPITIVKNPLVTEMPNYQKLAEGKDMPILVAAINYQCHCFVTGNLKDFKIKEIKKRFSLKIISLKEALGIFKEIDPKKT